jgi:beta-mannosidase
MKTVEVKIPVGLMRRLCCCLFIFISLSLSAQNIPLDNWVFRMNGEEKWLKAAVPGTVHTDLMMNARIPDPFVEQNETTVGWVGKSDWEYQSEFTLTDSILQLEQIELCFEGLDTYADVYLNDVLLGSSDNMFRSWIYNVKQFVKTENKLKVRFHAVETVATKLANKVSYTLPEGLRCYTRKAQYQYGWDWGPRLLTCGIWKPVYLRGAGAIQLQSLFVNAVDSGLPLKLQASVGITATESRKVSLELSCKQFPVTVLQEVVLQKGYQLVRIPFLFPDGKRWYPWQKGEQPLYDFSCRVIESNGSPVKCTSGFCSAQLIQEKDSIGESFGFRINDKNLYARGANLIPPHLFLPSVPDSEYETLIKKAKAANINMLRVWGGGAYLPESFYRYCDQYGMMVWQDFMFACSMVPGDSAFAENVHKEAIEQVQRLSVHPCIVLWCGNNESDEGWHNWGWQKQFNYSKADSATIWKNYTRLFHEILA